jgi:MFS family permease
VTIAVAAAAPRDPTWPIYLVALGHGMTHWIAAAFYILVPLLQEDLGLSYAEVGLFLTVFYASSMAANIYSGYVVDAFGRRVLVQVLSLLAGALALALCGAAGTVLLAVIGAANNLWHPAAISYLNARYRARKGYALAMHALGANLGDTVAPLAAGALILVLSWRGTAAATAAVPILIAAALALFLLRSRDGGAGALGNAMSLRDYLRGLVGMMRSRAILALCLVAGFRSMGQSGLMLFLPLYLMNEVGTNPFWTGATLSALQLGGVVAAPLAGAYSDRIGRRPVVMAGLGATTLLILVSTFVDAPLLYVGVVSLLGFALFAVRPVIQSWLMDLAPPELAGSATSALFGAQALLSMLAPLIGGALADGFGLIAAFYFLAATILIANLLVFLLPRERAA